MAMNLTTMLVETAAPDQSGIVMAILMIGFAWITYQTLYKRGDEIIATIAWTLIAGASFYIVNTYLATSLIIITIVIMIREAIIITTKTLNK